jgi:transcriptional repressor of dcmA and dcmR
MREPAQFLTIDEAARLLRVSKTSLRRWTNSGRLRCYRLGLRNERRFRIDDLLNFLPASESDPQATRRRKGAEGADAGEDCREARDERARRLRHHICMHYRTPEEQWEMLRPHLQQAVLEGAAIHYLYDLATPKEIERRLRREGLDTEEAARSGRLRIEPASRAYLRTGEFSIQRMLDYVESSILGARAAGFDHIFLTGEMTWSLARAPGCDLLMEYEARLNPLIEKYPGVAIVCQYPLDRFDSATTIGALKAHPTVELIDGVFAGLFSNERSGDAATA